MPLIAALSGAILVYSLLILCLNLLFSKRIRTKQRLDDTKNLEKLTNPGAREPEFSLGNALIRPILNALISAFTVFVPNNAEFLKKTEEQLRQAGIRMNARNYRGAVLLFTVVMILVFIMLGFLYGSVLYAIIGGFLGLYAGFVLARFYLTSKITNRNKEIHHQMPEMMDLLSVSVSAGLGFDQALTYIVQKCKGALFDEINVAQREISLGKTRREALTGLSDRCGNLEMKTFVSAVLQADEMGASLQNVLQIQADTIRLAHKQAVEEEAQKLSIKMLFPLVFCIFPVILIVLMGPAFMSIAKNLIGVG